MEKIRAEEYTFVTNNRADFLRLYGKEELHASLIIILPNLPPLRQRELFEAALSHVGKRQLINTVLEVEFEVGAVVCREYPYPAAD